MANFQESIVAASPLPTGFAENGEEGADKDVVKDIAIEHEPGKISLEYGFPSQFEAPQANGGALITRPQVNGMFYAATKNESCRQQGSINTFDPEFVEKSGGYAYAAILDWWDADNERLVKVVSLVDENTYDFREDGPDDVHWTQCSTSTEWMPNLKPSYRTIVASFDSLALTDTMAYVSDEMTMPFDGYINCFTNLTSSPPIAKVPYCTCLDRLSGVLDGGTDNIPMKEYGDYAQGENLELSAFSAFADCYHKLYLVVGEHDNLPTTLNDTPTASISGCGLFMVSSSGLEGSAAQVMIPMKKGTKMRLFGKQTYTNEHVTSYAKYVFDGNVVYWNGTELQSSGNLLTDKETGKGTFNLSCVIAAYPAKGDEE